MFYIQPPKGLITLHNLEEIVFSRLEFLNVLGRDAPFNFNGKFEFLFEGSPEDCIGHFTLRLLTLGSKEFFSFWLSKEILLFEKRLNQAHRKQLYKLFKTILKHIKRRANFNDPLDKVLMKVSSFFMAPEMFKHILSKNHSRDCKKYYEKIDFEFLPDLVEDRIVDLHKGFAKVYCSQWKELLSCLFRTFILLEVEKKNLLVENFLSDPRIKAIWHKLKYPLYIKDCNFGKITASNIDREAQNFPPCMEHLHRVLRNKHRLSHYARFHYTLFLKECGMGLEDSIVYWQYEYSKPQNCGSLCTHGWKKNARKFIYSIRHTYGLEGGRKNYTTPNCRYLCEEIPGTNYEGGCPFKNFDESSLKLLLSNSMTKSEVDNFLISGLKKKPQDSCANFFKLKNSYIHDVKIRSPVEFYKKNFQSN